MNSSRRTGVMQPEFELVLTSFHISRHCTCCNICNFSIIINTYIYLCDNSGYMTFAKRLAPQWSNISVVVTGPVMLPCSGSNFCLSKGLVHEPELGQQIIALSLFFNDSQRNALNFIVKGVKNKQIFTTEINRIFKLQFINTTSQPLQKDAMLLNSLPHLLALHIDS